MVAHSALLPIRSTSFSTSEPSLRMNVLLLTVDDLRHEFLNQGPGVSGPGCDETDLIGGCSKMHTPNIDSLAYKSLVLQKNYAQQALCSPSRVATLTGRRPEATRVYDLNSYFRSEDVGSNFTTLPQVCGVRARSPVC